MTVEQPDTLPACRETGRDRGISHARAKLRQLIIDLTTLTPRFGSRSEL